MVPVQLLTSSTAKTHDLTTEWANFHWHTAYSPKGQNHTKSDMLWEQILPSHGFVAVDRQWADDHQWPVSMYLPNDHGKGVYLLEAYHQLHCLVSLHVPSDGNDASFLNQYSASYARLSGRLSNKGHTRIPFFIANTVLMLYVRYGEPFGFFFFGAIFESCV